MRVLVSRLTVSRGYAICNTIVSSSAHYNFIDIKQFKCFNVE